MAQMSQMTHLGFSVNTQPSSYHFGARTPPCFVKFLELTQARNP